MKQRDLSLLLFPILLLLAGIAFGDDPGNPPRDWGKYYEATSAITGLVTDNAALPMENAVITATRIGLPAFSLSDTSDASGAFFVGKLISGLYLIKAEKTDYLTQYFKNSETPQAAKPVTVARKDTVKGIAFELTRGAAISGTVFLADGVTPLSGADVAVFRPRDGRDLFERPHAQSDENGKYRISGLPSGAYFMAASKQGYAAEFYQEATGKSEADTLKLLAPEEKTGIDFSLGMTSAISGVITSESTGEPIAEAWVAIYARNSMNFKRIQPVAKARSDSKGLYSASLMPGSYLVMAEARGFAAEWFDNAATIDLAAVVEIKSGEHTQIDFALSSWGALSGTVTDAATTLPVARAVIHAYNEDKGIGQKRFFETASREDGTYAFAGLPSGRYIIEAKAKDHLVEFWKEADSLRNATIVTMEGGKNVTGINFTLSTGGSIQGMVSDAADNLPIANAAIEVQSLRGHVNKVYRTDAEGKYQIDGLPTGAYLVNAMARGYVVQWFDKAATRKEATQVKVASPDATPDINFALAKIEPLPRSISGLVIDDSTNMPIQNAMIMSVPVRTFARMRKALTAEDGTFAITGLAPGTYILLIHARGYKGEFYDDVHFWKEAKTIQVVAGQEVAGIEIGLCPQPVGAYQVAGRVADRSGAAVEGALVTLKADDQIIASAVTAEDGGYSVEGVPADSYALSASVPGYEDSTPAPEPLALGDTINLYGLTLLVTAKTTGVEMASALPNQFELEQNYPNPFNPSTQINFSLAEAGAVRLTVFDLLGREVKLLARGHFAAGQHSALWDGADSRGEKLASGIYYYRLEVQGKSSSFTKMRRMLLIK